MKPTVFISQAEAQAQMVMGDFDPIPLIAKKFKEHYGIEFTDQEIWNPTDFKFYRADDGSYMRVSYLGTKRRSNGEREP